MRNLVYMMVLQILVGIWLMVSPFVLGYREITSLTTNNMIFGAIVLILGIGGEPTTRKSHLGSSTRQRRPANCSLSLQKNLKVKKACLLLPTFFEFLSMITDWQ